jgi:hypothetical protein
MLWMDQLQRLTKYFFKQLSIRYFREIWFPNREQRKSSKAIFVLSLYTTLSFIFVNNANMNVRIETKFLFLKSLFFITAV